MVRRGEGIWDPQSFGPEFIEQQTGFKLVMTFTGFTREDGFVSPDLHEERERLSAQYGESNVLSSFFVEDGVVELGLFIRQLPEQPSETEAP